MNATQKKYAASKINDILANKIREAGYSNLAKPQEGMSKGQKHQQIVDGTAVIKPYSAVTDRSYYSSAWFDDDIFKFDTKIVDQQYKKDMKAYDKAVAAIDNKVVVLKNKAAEIIDEIYLGDSTAAMKLIADFQAVKV